MTSVPEVILYFRFCRDWNKMKRFDFTLEKTKIILMHDQEFKCIKCGKIKIVWVWLPAWYYNIDFMYTTFYDCGCYHRHLSDRDY